MTDNKVYVRKEGVIHTVYEDITSGQPLPLSSFDDQPAGGTLQTYTSLAEVQQRFPGREVVCFEKEKTNFPPVIRRNAAVKAEAAGILASLPKTTEQPAAPVIPKSKSQARRIAIQKEAAETPKSTHAEQASQFLKRLETAYKYASAKNKRILDIQIKIIKEFIGEIFD